MLSPISPVWGSSALTRRLTDLPIPTWLPVLLGTQRVWLYLSGQLRVFVVEDESMCWPCPLAVNLTGAAPTWILICAPCKGWPSASGGGVPRCPPTA